MKRIIITCVLTVLILIGCGENYTSQSISNGTSNSKQFNKTESKEELKKEIDRIKTGIKRDEVISIIGEPDKSESSEVTDTIVSINDFYDISNGEGYLFVYTNDVLTDKMEAKPVK